MSVGDIYNLKGEHIGSDNKNDNKVYLAYTNSSQSMSTEKAEELISSIGRPFSVSSISEVAITNDELNTRSFLTIRSAFYDKKQLKIVKIMMQTKLRKVFRTNTL